MCIGDIWPVGPVLLQVTQPRQPCYKLAHRLMRNQVVKEVMDRGWGGWYMRVLEEGQVQAGVPIQAIKRPHPQWPVRDAAFTMYGRKKDQARAAELAGLAVLSARWKRELRE